MKNTWKITTLLIRKKQKWCLKKIRESRIWLMKRRRSKLTIKMVEQPLFPLLIR
jgi:hypothetical protein